MHLFFQNTHPDWHPLLMQALAEMDADYLQQLSTTTDWLPGIQRIMAAFSIPLETTHYILLGESPYPRPESANGYAFWDQAVGSLWGVKGFSKEVNRATSLRNWLKMLLHARGDLQNDFSQEAIAQLDKTAYLNTLPEFFNRLLHKGFLLLNATLVYSNGKVNYHARQWRPFLHSILCQLAVQRPSLRLILLGRIAQELSGTQKFECLVSEHPYNISFITHPKVVAFFKPLDLLARYEHHH
jgi:uracil-DNA glycosylase